MARIKYVKYKNILKQILRNEEKNYYETQFQIKANDIRKTWNLINLLLNKTNKDEMSRMFKIGSNLVSDRSVIVNEFNKYFVELGPKLAEKIRLPNNNLKLKAPVSVKESIVLYDTNPTEIHNIISSLKNTSACGVDEIPVSAIKSVSDHICPILANLINHSISEGIFPDSLKIAKILPIFKSGDKTLISNYRPISLLNTFSKIYEKVIFVRFEKFLNKYKILYDKQFGFRKNRSTQLALISLLDCVTSALDKNEHALCLFIDLSKAFDTVNHSILLNKLNILGIRGIAHELIKSYLNHRMQYVDVDGVSSDLLNITCGVPQGSVLGPLLFLLYVNDMHTSAKLLQFYLFADDTTIVFTSKDINHLLKIVNNELSKLAEWFSLNKLALNVEKTNYMIFTNNNSVGGMTTGLFLEDAVLKRVHATKFLGVIIDDKLTWKNHTEAIGKKISSIIFIIRKIRFKINQKTAQKLYDSFVLSRISYCVIAWGGACKIYTSNLHRLQKRALRLCFNANSLKSEELFITSKRLSIEHIHNMQIALMVFQFFNCPCILPDCITYLFTRISDVHTYKTRSLDSLCLFTHFGRLNVRQNSLKIIAPILWNKIPSHIRLLSTVGLFKKRFKVLLLATAA